MEKVSKHAIRQSGRDSLDSREGHTPCAVIRFAPGTEMVALAIGRCQFRIQGSAVTGLSPVVISVTPFTSYYSRSHLRRLEVGLLRFSDPFAFALHTTRCSAGCEPNTRRRNKFPVEVAFNESRIATIDR